MRLILSAGLALVLSAGHAAAQKAAASSRTLVTIATHPGHKVNDIYSPVAHRDGHTFFAIPDAKDRPTVTHIAPDGKVTTVYLDQNPDYRGFPDPHNGFSVGLDPHGYLHVTGDMHQFGAAHSRHGKYPYPERYDDKHGAAMLYWRSVKPWDVSAGFYFGGAKGAPTTMPGTSWSYGRFFNDRDGNLYYSARVRAFWPRSFDTPEARKGAMGLGVFAYDPKAGRWRALGAPCPHPNADLVRTAYPVLFWANSGRHDTGQSYQVYQAHLNFDTRNRLHLAVAAHIGPNNESGAFYAYSDDIGETWHRADGTRIPGLPLRGEKGEPNRADVVQLSKHTSIVKVVADRRGVPAVHLGSGAGGWFVWNGSKWIFDKRIPGIRGYVRPDGGIVFAAAWGSWLADNLNLNSFSARELKQGVSLGSHLGTLRDGRLVGLRPNKENTRVTVAEIVLPESGTP